MCFIFVACWTALHSRLKYPTHVRTKTNHNARRYSTVRVRIARHPAPTVATTTYYGLVVACLLFVGVRRTKQATSSFVVVAVACLLVFYIYTATRLHHHEVPYFVCWYVFMVVVGAAWLLWTAGCVPSRRVARCLMT